MTKIVIVGAGHAGGRAAQNLLMNIFQSEVYLFGEEDYLPYERPPLSKSLLSGEKKIEDLYLAPSTSWIIRTLTVLKNFLLLSCQFSSFYLNGQK